MSEPPLKLYSGDCDASHPASCSSSVSTSRRQRELDLISGTAKPRTMPVAFGTLVQFLSQAIRDDCAWLDDFSDDTIQIDADLHDVILKYDQMRRRAA